MTLIPVGHGLDRRLDGGVPARTPGQYQRGWLVHVAHRFAESADQGGHVLARLQRAEERHVRLVPETQMIARGPYLRVRGHHEPLAIDPERDHRHPSTVSLGVPHQFVGGGLAVHHAFGGPPQRDAGPGTEETALGTEVQVRLGEEDGVVQRHHHRHPDRKRHRVVRCVHHLDAQPRHQSGQC